MLTTLTAGGPMRIMAAIEKVREHHVWHDGSALRGKPKFKLLDNPVTLLTGCCPRQSDLKRNLDSRIHKIVLHAYDMRMAMASGHALDDARQQRARFLSVGCKLAYVWLTPPKAVVRFELHTVSFPGHLFGIALRLRLGLPMPTHCRGGTCRCRATKAGTARRERAEWNILGHHLCSQCGWGGWRIKRHDKVARKIMLYLRSAGLRATDKCADVFPACPVSISSSGVPSMRTKKKILDIISTDYYGTVTAHNVIITHP